MEGDLAVGVEGHVVAVVVGSVVVVGAEEDEVFEVGVAAVGPGGEVVGFAPGGGHGAAAGLAGGEQEGFGAALGRGGESAGAAEVEELGGAAEDGGEVAVDLDESSLTGESLPVTHRTGSAVMSGALNGTRAFVLEATASAADSQYAAIVSLVQQAAESRAPVVRLADRYAVPSTATATTSPRCRLHRRCRWPRRRRRRPPNRGPNPTV